MSARPAGKQQKPGARWDLDTILALALLALVVLAVAAALAHGK